MIEGILQRQGTRPALVAPAQGALVTYEELGTRVERVAEVLRAAVGERGLVFLAPAADVEGVILYLGALRARLPLCLAEPQTRTLARLCGVYRPALVLATVDAMPNIEGWRQVTAPVPGYVAALAEHPGNERVHPELALLLTTSGSTGSPKLVRLTVRNLMANAAAIVEYLGLGPDERAVQSLPMHYSYGLSVLNSHLMAGGSIVLTPHSFLRPEFWRDVDYQGATSFAGVPYMYETLRRLRFDPSAHPSLRTFTQAGGALRRELVADFHARAVHAGARLVVMYGQTEATARISYVPPQHLSEKLGTIGVPIPGGRLWLEPLEDREQRWTQLIYEGDNVMMGYAEEPTDLALGDVQGGVLRTGDLGTMDADGYFTVVGRLKRFAKLYGRRLSLEDVERELEGAFPVRVIATDAGERLALYVAMDEPVREDALVSHIAGFLAVPPASIVLRRVDQLPLTATGKKDYKVLEAAR